MSQENVKLVRRGIGAWNRGDRDETLAALRLRRRVAYHQASSRTARPRDSIEGRDGRCSGSARNFGEDMGGAEPVDVRRVHAMRRQDVVVAVIAMRGRGRRQRGSASMQAVRVRLRRFATGRIVARRASTSSRARPSKPPGLRSRRCRGRT